MPASDEEKEFVAYVVDLMQSVGPVYAKGMFGGCGIFLDGLMFALIADNTLYLKANQETEVEFQANALEQFTYHNKDKELRMSYYEAPEEALEDAEVMRNWANKAFGVALKVARTKK